MRTVRTLIVVATMVVFAFTAAYSAVETKKYDAQFGLIVKKNYTLSPKLTFTPKVFAFICSNGVIQPWGYASLTFGDTSSTFTTTPSLGMVSNYRSQPGVGFIALKVNLPLGNWVTTHEYFHINYDKDLFYWGLFDRQWTGTYSPFIGLYWEVSNTDITRLQIGPHAGIGDFEFVVLLGKTSAVRALWTIF